METSRHDLYREVHKALRAEIFAVVREAGCLDWDDAPALEAFRARTLRLTSLLESHTHHEDRFVMPLVSAADPELFRLLERTHPRLDGAIAELARRIERGPAGVDPRAFGQDYYLRLASFAGEYLLHLAEEQLRANPALWARYDDATLRETEARLIADIPPGEMATWLELMLPAMNPVERRDMLAGMRDGMPPEIFAGIFALARRVLPPAAGARLESELNKAVAA